MGRLDSLNWKAAALASLIGIVLAALLAALLHLAGANSRGWLVLVLLLAAGAGIFTYRKISKKWVA
jgi:membrane protease YdiL (CAAX protease family)